MLITPQIQKNLSSFLDGVQFTIHKGGTRSGKTYSILESLILLATVDKTPTLTSVVAMTYPHLRKGAIKDFIDIMKREGLWDNRSWNGTIFTYTFPSGSKIEFFPA